MTADKPTAVRRYDGTCDCGPEDRCRTCWPTTKEQP